MKNEYLEKAIWPLLLAGSNGVYALERYEDGSNVWIAAGILSIALVILALNRFRNYFKEKTNWLQKKGVND